MPLKCHFFIESLPEPDLGQTAASSFGPVLPGTFNITSQFELATSKKAFAICRGIVLVQPQTATTVNLILRPLTQPYPGLNIKYFIYRGLKRDGFFTGDDKIIATGSSSSDFINKIRSNFTDYYHSMGITPEPTFFAKFIGFDSAIPLDTPISDFFFKESQFVEITSGVFTEPDNEAFELPLIDSGKWLGNFEVAGPDVHCGIDVVLNNGDYKHEFENEEFVLDLNYARASYADITIGSGDSARKEKLKREQSTQFIDIASFYGLFVKDGTVSVSDSGGVATTKTGAAIYNDLINRFANKNKWYTYIQSDRSRSYNFYDFYKIALTSSNCLKKGITDTALVENNYQTNGWPMLVVDTAQTGTTPENKLFLQLVTDNNVNTVLYGQIGVIKNSENNFCNADFLRLPPNTEGVYGNLTKVIELVQPRLADTDGTIVAGITVLLYHGVAYRYQSGTTIDETSTEVPVFAVPNFFDDVFGLIHSRPLMQLNADIEFSKMAETRPQLINHYFDRKQQGISAVQTVTINDVIDTGVDDEGPVARVTYVTEAVNVSTSPVSPTGSLATDTKTSPSAGGTVSKSKTYILPEPYHYFLQLFSDNDQTVTGLKLLISNGANPSKIILGLTKEENNFIEAIVAAQNILPLQLLNPKLFLLDLFEDGNELLSAENIKYQKYKVGVVGEQIDGSLKLFYPATDVIVYSLDRLYHFSRGYSKYVNEELKNELIMDLDISL